MREISVAEFFEKNRHLLGFDNPVKALLTVVKEACDNSLDATSDARILPEITVKIKQLAEDRFFVSVEDNGPGIVREQVPRVFGKLLYGSKFAGGRQNRGQQGIGISAAVLYSQLTTGKPVIIYSRTSPKKPTYVFHLRIDTARNEPIIVKQERLKNGFRDHGVRIEMEIEGRYIEKSQSVLEYLKQTAIVNPYAKITYIGPDGKKNDFPRATEELPVLSKAIKPHPYGVEIGVLERMLKMTKARNLKGFLTSEFCRLSSKTAGDICKVANLRPHRKPQDLNHIDIEKLWRTIQATQIMKPPLDCLSPISEKLLEEGLKKEFKAEFIATVTRPTAVYRGNPFQIETAILLSTELPKDKPAKIMRFANRVPLMYQASSCASIKAIQRTDWPRYGMPQQGGVPIGPIILLVHMASVWIPYTSESKEAIDPYPVIIKEMKLAMQDCARKLARYLSGRRRAFEKFQRQNLFEKYIPELSDSLAKLADADKEKIKTGLEKMLKKGVLVEESEG